MPFSLSMGQALWVIMIVAGPPLILMFVIGFVISIIQTATSINEPTLSFIQKLLMLFLFLAIYSATAGDLLIEYTSDLWLHIRSEELRLGNECVSKCRFRWSP